MLSPGPVLPDQRRALWTPDDQNRRIMDIALAARTRTAPVRSTVTERGRTKYRDPGLFTAVAQMAFVVAAEIALVLLLAVH